MEHLFASVEQSAATVKAGFKNKKAVVATIEAIFFLYISYVLTQNIFNKKYNAQCIALLAVTFVNFFPLTTSGSFYGNWLSLLYYLPIGFLINFSKNK